MELRQYFSFVWKWMWLIVLAVAVASISSYVASKAATPLYRTKATLMVGRVTQNPDPSNIQLYTSQQLAATYIQLATREPVLKAAIASLGLDMDWRALAGQVSANTVPQTQLLEIMVVDSDPYRAKALVDAIAQELINLSPGSMTREDKEQAQFVQAQLTDLKTKIQNAEDELTRLRAERDVANSARQIQDLTNQITLLEAKISDWQRTYSQLLTAMQGGDVNALTVIEEAPIPTTPFSPNTRNNVLIAAAIGLLLAVAGAVLIEYLDDTIKIPDDIERLTQIPVLTTVARIEGEDYPDKLVAFREPLSPIVEAYRVLRTNLQFSSVDKPLNAIMLSSPGPGEGKSITLANLAVVLAQSGKRVVIVDTDLRRPVQHRIFGLPNRRGFSDFIVSGEVEIEDWLQTTEVENLRLLSSGPLPPNPAELLSSTRMRQMVERLKSLADVVLFDSPPTLVVSDGLILSTMLDGILVVTDSGGTRRNDLKRMLQELDRVKANVLGVVLNRMSHRSSGYYPYYRSYYYYYSYSEDGKKSRRKQKSAVPGWLERLRPPPEQPVQKTES